MRRPFENINPVLLVVAIAAGVEAPVLVTLAMSDELRAAWKLSLELGSMVAITVFFLIGLPLFLLLDRNRKLRFGSVLATPGCLALTPYLLLLILSGGGVLNGGTAGTKDHVIILNGTYTPYGIVDTFLVKPAALFVSGVVGGLVAWLIAVGFKADVHSQSRK